MPGPLLDDNIRRRFVDLLEEPVILYTPVFDGDLIVDMRIDFCNRAQEQELAITSSLIGALASTIYIDLDKLWSAARCAWTHGTAPPYKFRRSGVTRADGVDAVYEVHTMRTGDHLLQVTHVRTAIEALSEQQNVTDAILEAVASSLILYRPLFNAAGGLADLEVVWKSGSSDRLWGPAALRLREPVSSQLFGDTTLIDLARVAWIEGVSEIIRRPPESMGATFKVAMQSIRRVDGLLLECVTDLTNEQLLASKIDTQVRQHSATLEALHDAVIVMQPLRNEFGTVVDAEFTYGNRAAQELFVSPFQHFPEDAIGQRASAIPAGFDPDNRILPSIIAAANGATTEISVTNEHANLSALRCRQISMSFLPMDNGSVLWLSRDRTELLEMQLATEQVEIFRTSLLDLVPTPIFVTKMGHGGPVIVQTNPAGTAWINRPLPIRVSEMLLTDHAKSLMNDALLQAASTGISTTQSLTREAMVGRDLPDFSIRIVHRPLPDGYIISTLHDVSEEVRQLNQARRDAETGLLNRTGIDQVIEAFSGDSDRRFAVAVVRFSRYDDLELGIGAAAALDVSVAAAQRLARAFSASSELARIDSGTFVFLFEGQQAALTARSIAATTAAAALHMNQSIDAGDDAVHVGAAIGLVLAPQHGADPATLIARARSAALHAARSGMSAVVWSPDIGQPSATRHQLLSDLEQAMDDHSLYTLYQPKVTADFRFVGAEALVRWQHPTRGNVPPDDFVPAVEQSMLTRRFTAYVLARALSDWVASGLTGAVSVNCPPGLLSDPALPGLVRDTLVATRASPMQLVLEVTERTFIGESAALTATVTALRSIGVKLSIDDFGAGSTSIRHLQRLGVAEVKLDRSYIADIDRDPINQTIARAVVSMATVMGTTVVAEGVETAGEAAAAVAAGCTAMQGFYFSEAITLAELQSRITADGIYHPPRA